ncbi:unnamed protein product, partial [Ectocarpus fasciculatus]
SGLVCHTHAKNMAQPWHVSRGGARGRGSSKQWPGRGPHRANVWTPSTATAVTTTTTAAAASAAVASASPPPALTARTSARKAADLVEAASAQSASEIEAHLKEAEERLAIVVAQEAEVRVIADEHLEKEAYLTKLLQDLHRHQREEQQEGPSSSSSQNGPALLTANADPIIDSVNTASTSGGSSSGKAPAAPPPAAPTVAVTRGLAIRDVVPAVAVTRSLAVQDTPPAPQALPEPDPASAVPPPITKATVAVTKPTGPTTFSAPTKSGSGVSAPGRQATSPRAAGGGRGVTASAAAVAGAATDGREPDPNLLLAMAIGGGMVAGGDDLLTRDAGTIAEYVRLMSYEVLGEEETQQGRDRPVERWHQAGLSLTEALDKAEATAARPARLPNLLALAAAIRPVDGSAATAAGGGRTIGGATTASPSRGLKRKGRDNAGESPGTAVAAAGGGGTRTGAPGAKRTRVDANAIMCPFELNGVCNDDDCRYQHLDVYLPPSLNPGTSPAPTAASATAASHRAKASASGPGGASPVPGPSATAAAVVAAVARADQRVSALGQHRLPAIDFTGAAK